MQDTKTEEIKPDLKRAKDLIKKGVQPIQIAPICYMNLEEVHKLRETVKY